MSGVLLVQPPFVQLNAPYPAPYYLKSFLDARGVRTLAADHSIGLFERIFCRRGLETVFSAARPVIEARLSRPPADAADEEVRRGLSLCLSQSRAWTAAADRLAAFLRGADREFGHLLSAANGALPYGARTERLLDSLGGQPRPDDARRIATALLSDLADLIAGTLDGGFSLVRYGESLAASVRGFSAVEPAADGWTLRTFYEPLLSAEWDRAEAAFTPTEDDPFLLACTVPFPGCLAGALAAARSAKTRFGARVRTAAGGGYVNTELRSLRSARFFDYFDFLCFDRGYGALAALTDLGGARPEQPLHKTVYRLGDRLVGAADRPAVAADAPYAAIDAAAPASVFPDYRGVDFSRYLLPVDDENPMHRLWSDGRWMKAYLAHGCYWAACAFCDVQLDYIRGFLPVHVDALFAHLVAQAEATGARGVHLADEAAPVASLLRLAELNRRAGLPLVFWGNIRFERGFTPDAAAVLASGGMLGVSAGIEIASERGFKRLGKGIGLPEVVRACAAFKEAGILVHAYLIFGFWDEEDGEIVDSAETMRQLFAAGLVDSAFWHKFVLTRHSRLMREKRNGRHPGLAPAEAAAGDFADNDLRFRGESRTERWSAPLDALAAAWMAGEELQTPVADLLPFRTPATTVAPDLAEGLLDAYARDRDRDREAPPEPAAAAELDAVFLGGEPTPETRSDGRTRLRWTYRLEERTLDLEQEEARRLAEALAEAGREAVPAAELAPRIEAALSPGAFRKTWRVLREGGLALLRRREIRSHQKETEAT